MFNARKIFPDFLLNKETSSFYQQKELLGYKHHGFGKSGGSVLRRYICG